MATSFAYCLIFIGLLSCFAEPLCWACIILVQLGLIALPVLLGYKFMATKAEKDAYHTSIGGEQANITPAIQE
jgi:hypothetical protein